MLAPAPVLIDTSAWIETTRPRGDARIRSQVSDLLRSGNAAWCEMVRLELWNGAHAREMPILESLGKALILLEITDEVWDKASSLAQKVRHGGKNVPAADLLIFACARIHGAQVLSKDRHYEMLSTL
jgi:predicted nucleic acid-binding protein